MSVEQDFCGTDNLYQRRTYLYTVVCIVTLSGCAGEGPGSNADSDDEDAPIETEAANWIDDNNATIRSAFDEIEQGEEFVSMERWAAALSHFQSAFEDLNSLHDNAEDLDSDDSTLSEIWTEVESYTFSLSEASASQYLAMNEMEDGNTLEAERLYGIAVEEYNLANEYASQLEDELGDFLESSIPTHDPLVL